MVKAHNGMLHTKYLKSRPYGYVENDGSISVIANSNETVTRMLLTKEVNLTSSFRGVDQY